MSTDINLVNLLDRRVWEYCSASVNTGGSGVMVVSSTLQDQFQYFFQSNTIIDMYDPIHDAWVLLPSPALGGTVNVGRTGTFHPFGPRALATGGTTTTINTNLTLARDLRGYSVRIIAGPNAGTEAVIKSNTVGPNATIKVVTPFGSAITSASEYILITGRVYMMSGGTPSATSFKYWCVAQGTWTALSITSGMPSSIGFETRLISTPSLTSGPFVTGTATSATSTTLVNNTKTWTTDNWKNNQVRITSGTGAGQFRTIASNTATTLTVSSPWVTTPDTSSVYVIEGNDDYIYHFGNAVTAMFRYSISGNSWSSVASRASAPGQAMSGCWVSNITDPDWLTESNYLNGQYIYSFRGSNGAFLDRYSISGNVWQENLTYSPNGELMYSGTGYNYNKNSIYIMTGSGLSNKLFRFDIVENRIEPYAQLAFQQGATVGGDRLFDVIVKDGTTEIRYIYFLCHQSFAMFRLLAR